VEARLGEHRWSRAARNDSAAVECSSAICLAGQLLGSAFVAAPGFRVVVLAMLGYVVALTAGPAQAADLPAPGLYVKFPDGTLNSYPSVASLIVALTNSCEAWIVGPGSFDLPAGRSVGWNFSGQNIKVLGFNSPWLVCSNKQDYHDAVYVTGHSNIWDGVHIKIVNRDWDDGTNGCYAISFSNSLTDTNYPYAANCIIRNSVFESLKYPTNNYTAGNNLLTLGGSYADSNTFENCTFVALCLSKTNDFVNVLGGSYNTQSNTVIRNCRFISTPKPSNPIGLETAVQVQAGAVSHPDMLYGAASNSLSRISYSEARSRVCPGDEALLDPSWFPWTHAVLSITTTSPLPTGAVDTAYGTTLAATGGQTPYRWSIMSNGLPAGLSLSNDTGVISGTPTTRGTSNLTVRCTGNNGLYGEVDLALTITNCMSPWPVLWESSSGDVARWLMRGTNLVSAASLSPNKVDPSWVINDFVDFAGTGTWDILWRSTSGNIAVWQMNGDSLTSATLLSPPYAGTNWRIIGGVDVTGDGKDELLWQSSGGQLAVWYMNGLTMTNVALFHPQGVDPNWIVVATADFNGDGNPDLLWQHTSGSLAVWYMNSTTLLSCLTLPQRVPAASWRVRGLVDVDGDGKADIVWQHPDGWLAVWFMEGITFRSASYLNPNRVSSTWSVRAIW
jgi:Putative Ig domain/FG-GAP-like repeat